MKQKIEVSKELFVAFTEVGFVYLKNPGIDEEKRQFMFSQALKFFELPEDVKKSCAY